jgi:hypothetical protein
MGVGPLLPLFKLGALGGGFAFLILVFRLLFQEVKRSPNGRRLPVRPMAIATIFLFALISFGFFVSGVLADQFAPDPFKNYVTLDLGHYGFDTTTNMIKFQMQAESPDVSRYLPKSEASRYDIILGIREDDQRPPEQGIYKTAIKHMKFSSTDMREWKPASSEELQMFNSKCVRFSIFGISNDEVHQIGDTFEPRKFQTIKLFDTRSTGNHCG